MYWRVLCVFIFYSLSLSSCGELSPEEEAQIRNALSDSLLTSTESWNVDMTIFEDSLRTVSISGNKAVKYHLKDRNYTEVTGSVKLKVYESAKTIKTWVSCKRAKYYGEDAKFEFFGDVDVRTNDSLRLRTSYLRWEQYQDKIYSPDVVTITTPTDSISGVGFESDSDFNNYIIKESSGKVIIEE